MTNLGFELFLCDQSVIILHGLSDLGFPLEEGSDQNLFVVKYESDGTTWYSKYRSEYSDIEIPWVEIIGKLDKDLLHPVDQYKRVHGKISGLNRLFIHEIFRRSDVRKSQLLKEKKAREQEEQRLAKERREMRKAQQRFIPQLISKRSYEAQIVYAAE